MKRTDRLAVVSRRAFCGGLASCVGLAVTSCIDGSSNVVHTGGLDAHGPSADASSGSDAGVDSGTSATCPSSGVTDVGSPTAFLLGKPVYFANGNFYVMRDSGGLYALTARCTHEGPTVEDDGVEFKCPRHAALFNYNGDVTLGPAFLPLKHYEMCTIAGGHVGVVTSQTVAKTQRLSA